jgi:hypothetical protein
MISTGHHHLPASFQNTVLAAFVLEYFGAWEDPVDAMQVCPCEPLLLRSFPRLVWGAGDSIAEVINKHHGHVTSVGACHSGSGCGRGACWQWCLCQWGSVMPVLMVSANSHRTSSRKVCVPTQKMAGLFFHPICRDDGTMKKASVSVGRAGIWKAKLCSAPVEEMIMCQKPSERLIFCQSIFHVQSAPNMNLRMDGSAGPSTLTPD